MSVLNFAAHSMDYQKISEGYTNENGDHIRGETEWVEDYACCDIVPAGQANTKTFLDGQTETYSYTIYNLPRDCRPFKYGDRIRIKYYKKADNVREFKVLGFHRYQLQCKIWV